MTIRVLIADDQAVVRAGFGVVLGSAADIEVVGEAADGLAAAQRAATLRPDVAPVRLDAEGVEQLVGPLRSAGLPVTVEVCGDPGDAGKRHDEVELFAQRILMEALTNVLRHAGPSPTHVRLDRQVDAVTIEVVDAGPVAGHRASGDGGGHGLVGMRERAELLGGALAAGHHGERGWLVQARLPRSPGS